MARFYDVAIAIKFEQWDELIKHRESNNYAYIYKFGFGEVLNVQRKLLKVSTASKIVAQVLFSICTTEKIW